MISCTKGRGLGTSGDGTTPTRADLYGAKLSGTNLARANLARAKLGRADLRRAEISRADLSGANLSKADLSGADLSGANLIHADLNGAKLKAARLSGADLSGANLREVDLREADFRRAHLREVDLSGANLSEATVGWTSFTILDLSVVKGLESVRHMGPSTVGIDTIYLSRGEIPEVFLRGAGVPDAFITYMASLVGKPIQFYSCFISYSNLDQAFAERLYADLQSKGVRCWFAPEDMKIGDRIRDRIEQSIRVYDKLLLVLSENSIRSEWVETEVETAFQQERQRTRETPEGVERPTVLFPVRLDEAINETSMAWARNIHRTRHIGDFSGWKNHDSYRRAFARLLRDLKAASVR